MMALRQYQCPECRRKVMLSVGLSRVVGGLGAGLPLLLGRVVLPAFFPVLRSPVNEAATILSSLILYLVLVAIGVKAFGRFNPANSATPQI